MARDTQLRSDALVQRGQLQANQLEYDALAGGAQAAVRGFLSTHGLLEQMQMRSEALEQRRMRVEASVMADKVRSDEIRSRMDMLAQRLQLGGLAADVKMREAQAQLAVAQAERLKAQSEPSARFSDLPAVSEAQFIRDGGYVFPSGEVMAYSSSDGFRPATPSEADEIKRRMKQSAERENVGAYLSILRSLDPLTLPGDAQLKDQILERMRDRLDLDESALPSTGAAPAPSTPKPSANGSPVPGVSQAVYDRLKSQGFSDEQIKRAAKKVK